MQQQTEIPCWVARFVTVLILQHSNINAVQGNFVVHNRLHMTVFRISEFNSWTTFLIRENW